MKRIFWLCFLFIMILFPKTLVSASETIQAKIGNKYFDTLEEAIQNASSTDIIELTSDVSLKETLEIHKTVNINLNNFNIEADEKVFLIQGGSLNLTGDGKIIETKPNYGAIMLKGSTDPAKKDFSTVSIGSGITLEGWSGIFINHENKTGYGILVNMNGTINAVNDTSGGPGAGIYVNGNIQNKENAPIVNLGSTAKITSTGNGIYAAGYATYTINGAYISGEESGLGIKSGVFNIINGTIVGTGPDKTPTSGNNNGINASGTAIQIESNSGYLGNIELTIKDGTIKSENSNVLYEYTVNNSPTQVKSINLSGGTYTSNAKKDVFLLSDSFKSTHSSFISGGTYSSDPSSYLKSGYSASENEKGLYEVMSNTALVFASKENNSSSGITTFIIIFVILILGMIAYMNRQKIFYFFKK